jgi:pyruvate/2-oxoglutarate dehydrogenase complex dihydrolipoamide acyltransferase (E2) component
VQENQSHLMCKVGHSQLPIMGSLFASPIIINQPQSAILGIGTLEKQVVVRGRPDDRCGSVAPFATGSNRPIL